MQIARFENIHDATHVIVEAYAKNVSGTRSRHEWYMKISFKFNNEIATCTMLNAQCISYEAWSAFARCNMCAIKNDTTCWRSENELFGNCYEFMYDNAYIRVERVVLYNAMTTVLKRLFELGYFNITACSTIYRDRNPIVVNTPIRKIVELPANQERTEVYSAIVSSSGYRQSVQTVGCSVKTTTYEQCVVYLVSYTPMICLMVSKSFKRDDLYDLTKDYTGNNFDIVRNKLYMNGKDFAVVLTESLKCLRQATDF